MAEALDRLRAALAQRYTLEREIGRGGMATVYLAHDLRHQRPVALKVLRPDVSAILGAERFHQEIRTAAGLQHPHILPLYDSGDADGLLYFTMPFVEGRSLRDRLTNDGRLPVDETVRIGLEVAQALGHAHQRGVVHRDIKPENILVGGGYALVADFGIARALSPRSTRESRLTEPGLLIGTPEYMSPEQSGGEPDVDGRSDLYSLATVLYELLAGEVPYTGTSAHAIIARRFSDPVPSVSRLRPDVPRPLDLAIMKGLALEPADRFATADEFCAALRAPEEALPAPYRNPASRGAEAKPPPNASIAVLPFANTSSDPENEYFSDGIAEELLEALARVPGLKVAARTSSFAFKGRSVDLRSVAQQLGVRTLLEGSVRRSGDRVRITAQLVDAQDGCYIWSERYDRGMQEIFALQDEIARAIVTAVQPALQLRTSQPPPPPTADREAYELFLKGRYYVQHVHTSLPLAVKYLEEAIQRDPNFALAHAHLARAYMFAGTHHVIAPREAFPRSRVAALRALELDDSQAAIHSTLGILSLMHDWDWKAAAAHLQRAAQLTGDHQLPSFGHALLAVTEGRIDDAVTISHRILELDPASQKAHREHAVILSLARRPPEVLEHTGMILEMSPGTSEVYRWIGQAYEDLERWPEALEAHRTGVTLSRRNGWSLMGLARVLYRMNLTAEGDQCLAELTEGARQGRTQCIAVAAAYAGAGQPDPAFEWLTRSIEGREPWLVFLNVDPIFDGIRHDPRFAPLVRRIGIPS